MTADAVHEVPATRVERPVDTTGAGDLFAAGFLHGLTHGMPLPECARLGGLAAAEIISHFGARPEVRLADLAGVAASERAGGERPRRLVRSAAVPIADSITDLIGRTPLVRLKASRTGPARRSSASWSR